jgi:DNA-binding transcriptional LysR family regulator
VNAGEPLPGAELRHLRAFVAAAEAGTISAAARRLHLSQQAVSRTVAALEATLGVELFERGARRLALTAAGDALLPGARRTLASADDAFVAARTVGARRPLRVDISSGGIATGALILRRLRREQPGIAIEQVEVGVARGLELLGAGELDLVLGLAIPPPSEIRVEDIRHERVLVGMAADHPLAAAPEVAVRRLEGVPLLLPAESAAGEWNAFVEAHLRAAGVEPQRAPTVTHGSVAATEVLREGGCVVPTMSWTDPPPGLVFRPLVDPPAVMTWSLMWRRGDERHPRLRALLAAARGLSRENAWLTVR